MEYAACGRKDGIGKGILTNPYVFWTSVDP